MLSFPARSRVVLVRALVAALLVMLGLGFLPGSARSAQPTERGLDLWIHAPQEVAAGDTLPIDVLALGFPTATSTTPLSKSTVEVAWDPESLIDPTDKSATPASAPPAVRGITDDEGRVTLMLPVPKGVPRVITLLVSIKIGDRERVRELSINRTVSDQFDLFMSDARVVPGSEVVAWALWTSKDRSRPVANAPIEFVLSQGGVVRFRKTASTDPAGASMARIPIPRDDEPGARWLLVARPGPSADVGKTVGAEVELAAREETPGKPTLWSTFEDGSITAGQNAKYRIRVRDASGEGIASHKVFLWSGPKGTEPPTDGEEFKKAAVVLTTDGAGEIRGTIAAPTTIPLRGTSIKFEARTDLEGQARSTASSIDVGQKRGFVTLTAEGGELVPGLAVAVSLGYVEDLHQGAPVGVLTLAFAISFLVLHWAAGRIAVRGWSMRALVSLMAVALIDTLTILTLLLLADPLAIRTEALWPMALSLRWHALATVLVAPPVWSLLQRTFTVFRLDAQPPSELHLDHR